MIVATTVFLLAMAWCFGIGFFVGFAMGMQCIICTVYMLERRADEEEENVEEPRATEEHPEDRHEDATRNPISTN